MRNLNESDSGRISGRRQLVLSLELLTILAGLPIVLAVGYAAWMLKLQRDLRGGRRVRLKWKDLSMLTKLYVMTLAVYSILVLYSDASIIIPIMAGTRSTFPAVLQNVVISLWLASVSLLGFGLFYSLRSPVKKTTL